MDPQIRHPRLDCELVSLALPGQSPIRNLQSAIRNPNSLDRMRPGHAFLGTTNLDLTSLTERFQTRFQSVRLQPPENESLAAFLARRWGASITITRQIAEGAKGNVRAARADLEMWMG
jgi:hypothetical protein